MGNQSSRDMMERYRESKEASAANNKGSPATVTTTPGTGGSIDPLLSQRPKSEPPKMHKNETFEEKLFRKFTSQPLIPIGCAATAYFLLSGIKSFSKRDPINSQRMMRNRVGAQFLTLMAFIAYCGVDQFDFRLAPMYQDVKKVEQILQEQDKEAAMAAAPTDNKQQYGEQ